VVIRGKSEPGCLSQALWFTFIGWWLGALWVCVAWTLCVTLVGLPVGIAMLHRVPKVMTGRSPESVTITRIGDLTVVDLTGSRPQRSFLWRAIYFVLIGCWFSGIWIALAYIACLTLIGMPLGLRMFEKVPAVLTLRR